MPGSSSAVNSASSASRPGKRECTTAKIAAVPEPRPIAATVASMPEVRELNIGHFLAGEAIFDGLKAVMAR